MKFRAHDTFFIRKGWLSKGMAHVVADPEVFVSKINNPMDVLGIGANMVKALRYWLQAVGLTLEAKKGKRVQNLTHFGKLIYENDTYIEELGTLQLLQYKLANNIEEATSWYFFYNVFNMSQFTQEDFITQIQSYLEMNGNKERIMPAVRSLGDDFTCIVNTYVPRYKSNPGKVSAENNIDCPFGELGLVDIINKEKKNVIYTKSIPSPKEFNPWVVLAVIQDKASGRIEVPLNELLHSQGNIGKVFNLDSIAMLEILHNVEKIGELKIIRTAGLDVIKLIHSYNFLECVKKYYQDLTD